MRRSLILLGALVLLLGIAIAAVLSTTRAAESESIKRVGINRQLGQVNPRTEIEVYALARGGRFIGDDIGGAQITLRDALSGEFLASGRTRGGSGVPDLMTLELARTTPIPTQDAAVFTATLELDEPRLIQVDAFAPLGAQGSANRATATQWVVPDAIGQNRIIIEIPGLNVEVVEPPTHFMPKTKPHDVQFRVNVTMICGCPIGPTTDWKPENYDVKALLLLPDGTRDLIELEFDATAPDRAPSQFVGTYTVTEPGIYDVIVHAHQVGEGNSGSDRVTFIVP